MFELPKEDIKIIQQIDILIVFILDVFTTYGSCLTLIGLTVVLCALYEPNYNLKAIIVAIVMKLNNYYDLVSNCFIRFYKHILN